MPGLVATESAKRELAQLELIAADASHSMVERAEALMIAHQRFDVGGCLCGWNKLGASYAGHQVTMLARAGLLAVDIDGRAA